MTHTIERPDGFSDEEYTIHAQKAAELVARVLTGEPGDILRVTGVVMMVVEENSLDEENIGQQLSSAAHKFNDNQTWRDAHVIPPSMVASS